MLPDAEGTSLYPFASSSSCLSSSRGGGGGGGGGSSLSSSTALVSRVARVASRVVQLATDNALMRGASQSVRSLMYVWIRFWIYAAGLHHQEKLLRQLFLQWKFRKNQRGATVGASPQELKGVLATVSDLILQSVRMIFVPEVFMRYLAAVCWLHLLYDVKTRLKAIVLCGLRKLTQRGRQIDRLRCEMDAAESLAQYQQLAQELDKVEGHDKWRQDPYSPKLLYERVMNKTQMYKQLQKKNDVMGLMFALRAGLLRNHWGLDHPDLYSVSHVGTKHVVDEYLDTIVQSMNTIIRASGTDESSREELSLDNKLAFFSETRHAFGRSALLLSGGGSLGFYHTGVVMTLVQQNLLPTVIAGSSAGSIAAGILAVSTDEDLVDVYEPHRVCFTHINPNITDKDYQEFTPTWMQQLKSFLPEESYLSARDWIVWANRWFAKGYLFENDDLHNALRKSMGDYTFREAYDRTGRIVNITVTPVNATGSDQPHLLNYLTAPNVIIWSASLASCAIPQVFRPVELLAKDKNGNIVPYYRERQQWSDGSVECDLPMQRLSELFNVNHFIVSQVNLHHKLLSSYASNAQGTLLDFLKQQMKAYFKNIVEFGLSTPVFRFFDIGLIPLLTQRYEGDITICPTEKVPYLTLMPRVMRNPTTEEYIELIKAGQRATWRHVPRIRTMCRVEFALERAVRYLRGELALEEEQKHGKTLGRVPSFYTSPSTLNLSSLDQTITKTSRANDNDNDDDDDNDDEVNARPFSASRLRTSSRSSVDVTLLPTISSSSAMSGSLSNTTITTTTTTAATGTDTGSGGGLRRNRSIHVAGAVMTFENGGFKSSRPARQPLPKVASTPESATAAN